MNDEGSLITDNRQYYVQAEMNWLNRATGRFVIAIYDKPPRLPRRLGYLKIGWFGFQCAWWQRSGLKWTDAGTANSYLQANKDRLK